MKLWIDELKNIPTGFESVPGVYFLFSNEKLIYIGTSWSIGARVSDLRCIKDFLKFAYMITHAVIIECDDERTELEDQLIKFYQPIANRTQLKSKLENINKLYNDLEKKYNELTEAQWSSAWALAKS